MKIASMVPNSLSTHLLSLFIVTTVVFSDDCPQSCICTSKKNNIEVKCSSKGIKELRIAQLPKRTITLDLSDNQIRVIRRSSFPASKTVRRLDLKRNNIEYIEPGALAKFPKLARLYLQVNQLKRIEKGAFQGLRRLKQLTLQVNQLNRIEKDTFFGLRNIKLVNISQNKLIDIHRDALSSFKRLKKISLKENLLTTFEKYTFPNSSLIELDGNKLICDCGMSWLIMKSAHEKRGATESSRCAYPKALEGKQLKKLGGNKWNCRAAEFELPDFNVAPSKNQVVFQNDSFQLTCSSLWQPRGQLLWKVDRRSLRGASVVDEHDVNSRKNKSILLINRAGLHHSGDYVCQAVIGNGMQTSKTVSISVIGWQTQFCPLQHISTEKGKFLWHSTVSGATAVAECPFDTRLKAKRKCTDGRWEEADIGSCFYENLLTRKLDLLSKREINQTSLPQIFYDLAYITKKHQSNITDTKQLHYLFKIFAKIGAAKLPMRQQLEKEIRKATANVFTSVISMHGAAMAKSEANNKQTLAWMVPVIEKFMKDSLDLELQSKTEDVPVVLPVTSELAAYSRSYIYTADFPLYLVCNVLFRNLTFPNSGTLGECSRSANTTALIEGQGFDARIEISSDVFSLATPFHLGDPYQLINVTFIGFNSPELFGDSKLEGISSKTKNTSLNSAVIGIHVQVPGMRNSDIITRFIMSFKHFKPGIKPRLVYWSEKTNSEKAQWRINTKCKAIKDKARHSKFLCSELPGKMTYFAVVMVH